MQTNHDDSIPSAALSRRLCQSTVRNFKAGRIKAQDERDRLFLANIPMAVSFAARHGPIGLEAEDAVQAALLGLLKAAERFDPGLDVAFSTYATYWIRQSVFRAGYQRKRVVSGKDTVSLSAETGVRDEDGGRTVEDVLPFLRAVDCDSDASDFPAIDEWSMSDVVLMIGKCLVSATTVSGKNRRLFLRYCQLVMETNRLILAEEKLAEEEGCSVQNIREKLRRVRSVVAKQLVRHFGNEEEIRIVRKRCADVRLETRL